MITFWTHKGHLTDKSRGVYYEFFLDDNQRTATPNKSAWIWRAISFYILKLKMHVNVQAIELWKNVIHMWQPTKEQIHSNLKRSKLDNGIRSVKITNSGCYHYHISNQFEEVSIRCLIVITLLASCEGGIHRSPSLPPWLDTIWRPEADGERQSMGSGRGLMTPLNDEYWFRYLPSLTATKYSIIGVEIEVRYSLPRSYEMRRIRVLQKCRVHAECPPSVAIHLRPLSLTYFNLNPSMDK